MTIDVEFIDSGKVFEGASDPKFPDGKPVDLALERGAKTCTYNLPHPAPGFGAYHIKCRDCDFRGVILVTGRPDDPNMVTIPCQQGGLDG